MARASAFQAEGRGFESRFPLQIFHEMMDENLFEDFAHVAQLVEHILGKDEVTSSILVVGSRVKETYAKQHYFSLYRMQAAELHNNEK